MTAKFAFRARLADGTGLGSGQPLCRGTGHGWLSKPFADSSADLAQHVTSSVLARKYRLIFALQLDCPFFGYELTGVSR